MRNRLIASLLIVMCAVPALRAQNDYSASRATPISANGSYGIHGSDLLWQKEAELRTYVAAHPEADLRHQLNKQAAWGFTVGSTKSWYATNLTTNSEYLVPSTCRAVGTNCYVFAEDALWGTRITQAIIDSVRNAFDLRTPANASKGIYQTDVDAFGTPPDVDNDPRIIILVLDIKDGYAGTGGYVEGYFYSLNEVNLPTSNKAEIYYLDANPLDLTTASGLQGGLSTTAHEFQHMIHYNYDPSEISFVNEGCSLVAEVNAGYPLYSQSGFANESNFSLLDWRRNDNTAVLKDYSRAARFFTYIRDQLGMSFFKPLVATNFTGASGISFAMQQAGISWTFSDLVQNFEIANLVNDRTMDVKYGYVYTPIVKSAGTTFLNPSYTTVGDPDQIQPYGAMYWKFKAGSNLKATVTADAGLVIKALEIGTGSKKLVDVASGVQFAEAGFGSTYPEVDFIIINRDASVHAVTSTVTGNGVSAVEIKYEYGEPSGYLSNADGDTTCVTFDGVAGAKIDSIRIAFRRPGTMTGGIWSLNTASARPLGTPLAVPLSATSTMAAPTVPYPVPWPSWATMDVRSLKIDASNSFAVAVANKGVYTGPEPRVMVSKYASSGAYHNYTFQNTTEPGAWYYLSATTDSIWVYHIHAFVSFGPTDVRLPMELVPTTTTLAQNYPNPFNPSTTIRFTLAARQFVSVKIYDVLGKEVATIVNEELSAGTYSRVWNAASMPSGMYFSTMRAGGTTETKRILLTK